MEKCRFQAGDQVDFKATRGPITIVPKRPPASDCYATLTAGEAKLVRRGEAQLKREESKPWRSVKHAFLR